jgi:hypothetical protein
MISGHFLERFINSPAHHTLHHLYFTCNYGQVSDHTDSSDRGSSSARSLRCWKSPSVADTSPAVLHMGRPILRLAPRPTTRARPDPRITPCHARKGARGRGRQAHPAEEEGGVGGGPVESYIAVHRSGSSGGLADEDQRGRSWSLKFGVWTLATSWESDRGRLHRDLHGMTNHSGSQGRQASRGVEASRRRGNTESSRGTDIRGYHRAQVSNNHNHESMTGGEDGEDGEHGEGIDVETKTEAVARREISILGCCG